MGVAATALRLGAGVGRLVLLPGRVLARSPFVEPVLRGRAERLAAAGREAEARGRRGLEAAAGGILASPETARTLDRALTETVPDALGDEAIETLARRLLESPTFERVLREAAESRLAHDLLDEAIRSAELQRAVEGVLSGPAVRGALGRETRTLWGQVTARVVAATGRLDDSAERLARRAIGRHPRAASAATPYVGLTGRGVALLVDLALTNVILLTVAALLGVVGWLLGISLPGVVLGALAGAGWLLFLTGYFALFWSTAGQTPGMRVIHARVQGRDGLPPRVRTSLLRFAAALLALAPLGAGLVPVLYDSRRRALHDFIAGTVVVRDAPPPLAGR